MARLQALIYCPCCTAGRADDVEIDPTSGIHAELRFQCGSAVQITDNDTLRAGSACPDTLQAVLDEEQQEAEDEGEQ